MGESGAGVTFSQCGVGDLCPAAVLLGTGAGVPGEGGGGCPATPGVGSALRDVTYFVFQDSDGDKSDDLVVDVSNEVSRGGVSAGPLLSPQHDGALGCGGDVLGVP